MNRRAVSPTNQIADHLRTKPPILLSRPRPDVPPLGREGWLSLRGRGGWRGKLGEVEDVRLGPHGRGLNLLFLQGLLGAELLEVEGVGAPPRGVRAVGVPLPYM